MLVTIERTAASSRPLPDLLVWCQSAHSRAHWPGVEKVRWDDTNILPRLYYAVHVAAPGAPEALVEVEEHMCRPEEDDDGIFFESAQLWTWPTRHVAGAWATYHFSDTDSGARFRFVFKHLLPDLGGADVFRRARFGQAIERAVDLYVERVVAGGVGGAAPEPPEG
jgi:hypothetical protein